MRKVKVTCDAQHKRKLVLVGQPRSGWLARNEVPTALITRLAWDETKTRRMRGGDGLPVYLPRAQLRKLRDGINRILGDVAMSFANYRRLAASLEIVNPVAKRRTK